MKPSSEPKETEASVPPDAPSDDRADRLEDIKNDAKDLRRGVAVNLIGYAIKVAYPILTGVLIYLYGKSDFGIFTAAQAALLVTMRISLMGFDKGILWWVPRQSVASERLSLRPALFITGATSTLAAVTIAFFLAPWLAKWRGEPLAEVGLRWMAAGLVPMTMMEMLINACLGKRRMEAQVIVKEGIFSTTLVLSGIVFHFAGFHTNGLAMAYVTAAAVGLLSAIWLFRRVFRESTWERGPLSIPKQLRRYVLPMWMTEITGSVLIRMDILVLTALSDPGVVGVYGAVVQIGNAIRSIRQAFDPIVLSIMSQISSKLDKARLVAAFSHATSLVIATQLPVYAFIVVFAPWILPLLGEGYDQASTAVIILCGFWIINGMVGLNGLIVTGYGRSDLAFLNTLITIGLQALFLRLFIPRFGLEGAAASVGVAYTLQNIIQAVQARVISGIWAYNRNVARVIFAGILAGCAMAAAWWGLSHVDERVARIGAFIVFLGVLGPLFFRLYRKNRRAAS